VTSVQFNCSKNIEEATRDICMMNYRGRGMVFNATFNNVSAISWRSVLLVEETVVPRENYQPAASHW